MKIKFPFQLWALFVELVMLAPEVLSMMPPLMVNVPVPKAEALLIYRVAPEFKVTPPVKVLAWLSVAIP